MLKIIYFWIITLLSPMIFCILIEVTNSSNVLKESGPQEPTTDQPIKNVCFHFIEPTSNHPTQLVPQTLNDPPHDTYIAIEPKELQPTKPL